MKKTLQQAPLVHALIHLRFSAAPDLSLISDDLKIKLHKLMIKEGFPEKIDSNVEMLKVAFNPATNQASRSPTTRQRTLFRAAGEMDIVELSATDLILKSTAYVSFEDFDKKFSNILVGCCELIPDLNQTLIKSVGLRYTDVIVPTASYELSDFIKNGMMPLSKSISSEKKHLHGLTMKAIETAPNQVLVINFEELETNMGRVHKVLPDTLFEPDNKCSLRITGQESWANVNSKTYGLLDIDHTHNFSNSPNFDLTVIKDSISELHDNASSVFWESITDSAKEAWGFKEN